MSERITVDVDPRSCEGHGVCTELSPEMFDLGDEDVATVADHHPGPEHQNAVRAAAAACPRQAIILT